LFVFIGEASRSKSQSYSVLKRLLNSWWRTHSLLLNPPLQSLISSQEPSLFVNQLLGIGGHFLFHFTIFIRQIHDYVRSLCTNDRFPMLCSR